MKKITVYHGTTRKRGESIINDGLIDSHATGDYDDATISQNGVNLKTTKGYVYVTDDPVFAYYMGQKNAIYFEQEREYMYLFEIELPLEKVISDIDDLRIIKDIPEEISKNMTGLESLEECSSARVKGDIVLDSFKHRVMKLPIPINRSLDRETSLMLRTATRSIYKNQFDASEFLKYIKTKRKSQSN